ncbi:MAG: patatin-like phospholipase family protein [Candidatus Dormibacteria bacterium]
MSKTALVLCGGGVTGAVYEMGALRALDDILVDRTVNDFDIYVGTSAGAVVCSLLANGIDPAGMLLEAEDPQSIFNRAAWSRVYRPNLRELPTRLGQVPRVLATVLDQVRRTRAVPSPSELFMLLSPLIPAGIFDSEGIRMFLRELLTGPGMTDSFTQLGPDLNIVTTELDSFRRVVFGRHYRRDVHISTAVAASTAVPILYRPMTVRKRVYADGGIKGTASVDVALAAGADLVLIINPLVPVDISAINNDARRRRPGNSIYDLGVRAIYNQLLRGMIHDTLISQLQEERRHHPDVDFILIEPRPDDPKMFFHEVMSFSARLMVAQHGYESVTQGLEQSWDYVQRVLHRHGVSVTRDLIRRKPREVEASEVESPSLLRRLRQTVLAPPRRRVGRTRSALRAAMQPKSPKLRLVRTLEDLDERLG